MSDWSLDQARKTYSIPHWAEGYFDVDAAGRVVLSEVFATGEFRARVNGQPAEILRVNHAFKGVALPGPGMHRG